MRTRLTGIAGLALGLTMLGGGAAAVSAHGGAGVPLAYTAPSSQGMGAGLSAPLYRLMATQATTPSTGGPAQDPACATQGQDQPGAAETDTANAVDTDTVDLQCGNQTGADTASTGNAESAGAPEADDAAGNDFAVDGIDQQGQNQGE